MVRAGLGVAATEGEGRVERGGARVGAGVGEEMGVVKAAGRVAAARAAVEGAARAVGGCSSQGMHM